MEMPKKKSNIKVIIDIEYKGKTKFLILSRGINEIIIAREYPTKPVIK